MWGAFAIVSLFLNDIGNTRMMRNTRLNILENYNHHVSQVIDMFPDFYMHLRLEKKTSKVLYLSASLQ